MSNESISFDQAEALALLDRLFGPSSSSPSLDHIITWRDAHHHRSSSLSSTSSSDSYWSGPFLSVPDTPIDRTEQYPFDIREPPQPTTSHPSYQGPRITVSPVVAVAAVESKSHAQTHHTHYLSRGGRPKTADKPSTSWSEESSLPSITVELAD